MSSLRPAKPSGRRAPISTVVGRQLGAVDLEVGVGRVAIDTFTKALPPLASCRGGAANSRRRHSAGRSASPGAELERARAGPGCGRRTYRPARPIRAGPAVWAQDLRRCRGARRAARADRRAALAGQHVVLDPRPQIGAVDVELHLRGHLVGNAAVDAVFVHRAEVPEHGELSSTGSKAEARRFWKIVYQPESWAMIWLDR